MKFSLLIRETKKAGQFVSVPVLDTEQTAPLCYLVVFLCSAGSNRVNGLKKPFSIFKTTAPQNHS